MSQTNPAEKKLTLRCLRCNAKLRASRELLGRTCPCPRCRSNVLVRVVIPSDADVALVPEPTP
jgi:DNA-directed RNA polymerase subunit RPC12/RpoP